MSPSAAQPPQPAPIVVLVGPAGCGKSTIGARLAASLGLPFIDGDDLHAPANVERMRRGLPLEDAHRGPWLERIHAALLAAAQGGTGLIVACSALKQSYRDRLAAGGAPRFFELAVPVELLRARLADRRDHFFPPDLLDDQLAVFEPLPGPQRVDATVPPDQVVAHLRRQLRS